MNWMAKARGAATAVAAVPSKPGPAVASPATSQASAGRTSNGLKEFLWLLSDVKRGRILDLCPATQSTLNFFIEKGYRISAEDMLRTWKHFLNEEEERMRDVPAGEPIDRISKAELGAKFLESNLNYPAESFHGILAWDFCDYFDPEVLPQVMQRIYDILHPNGAVLAMFHSRPKERFSNYRVVDGQTIEPVAAPTVAVHTRVFQNREILDLFDKFRSSKTFVGRDQVREALFLK
ncbi:MAG TPA: class I SAM-dependent methyltransferase [Candidatus Acidoferrales bacterium]|nr:class I SAM-dependent methyltransferase [Candidatus Acidoferrales bacterium]